MKYLTARQISDTTGYRLNTVYQWILRGELRATKMGHAVFVRPKDLEKFLSKLAEPTNRLGRKRRAV